MTRQNNFWWLSAGLRLAKKYPSVRSDNNAQIIQFSRNRPLTFIAFSKKWSYPLFNYSRCENLFLKLWLFVYLDQSDTSFDWKCKQWNLPLRIESLLQSFPSNQSRNHKALICSNFSNPCLSSLYIFRMWIPPWPQYWHLMNPVTHHPFLRLNELTPKRNIRNVAVASAGTIRSCSSHVSSYFILRIAMPVKF